MPPSSGCISPRTIVAGDFSSYRRRRERTTHIRTVEAATGRSGTTSPQRLGQPRPYISPQEACTLGGKASPSEYYLRLRDKAELLLVIGRPAEVLATLERSRPLYRNRALFRLSILSARVQAHLIATECLIALGDTQGGSEQLHSAEQISHQHAITHFAAQFQRLTPRLQ